MNVKLGHLEAGQKELSNTMEKKFDKKFDKLDSDLKALGNKMDNKFDRMLYFFLGALVLEGGFDFYMQEKKQQKLVTHKQQ